MPWNCLTQAKKRLRIQSTVQIAGADCNCHLELGPQDSRQVSSPVYRTLHRPQCTFGA